MTRWDYTEHPSAEAMDWLAEQALRHEIERNCANRRIIREDRAACARKGR